MTLNLSTEVAEKLKILADTQGLSVEDYLGYLVHNELPAGINTADEDGGSGMVWENGLYIYGKGTALPDGYIEEAVRRSREEQSQRVLDSDL